MSLGEWSGLTCPKCSRQLYMREGIHTLVLPLWDKFIYPSVEQEVHGYFKDNFRKDTSDDNVTEVYVPDISLIGARINLDFANTEPKGRRFSMKVARLVRLDEHLQVRTLMRTKLIKEISFKFVRFL